MVLNFTKLQGYIVCLTLSSIYTRFNTLKKKSFRKTLWKKVKLLKMSNFTFFHNVFYAILILKSFNSHISVVVCSFFEFGTVSKWCIREWVGVSLPGLFLCMRLPGALVFHALSWNQGFLVKFQILLRSHSFLSKFHETS